MHWYLMRLPWRLRVNFCSLTVSSGTFNGITSYVEMQVDTTIIPFGDYGSFSFRTREMIGRLLYIQLLDKVQQPTDSIEFEVFNGQLQLTTRFQTGRYIC